VPDLTVNHGQSGSGRSPTTTTQAACSSRSEPVSHLPGAVIPKLRARVRFPSPAPQAKDQVRGMISNLGHCVV
jgi:hypothetical protein